MATIIPASRPSPVEARALRAIGRLRRMRAFERRHLHHVRSLEDRDLLFEIGHHQGSGRPLTMHQIHRLDVGSVATVQRRLRRLRHEGCIQETRSERDHRRLEYTLSTKVLQIFDQYAALLGTP